MIATVSIIGLFIVYLVNNADPNLGPHALGLYFVGLFIDIILRGK